MSNSIILIPLAKIGPIKQVNDNVYTAKAMAPTGEKMYLAMEPMGDGDKWETYKNAMAFLTTGGNEMVGTIGSITELAERINDEMELQKFLSSRTYPDFWTADTSIFNRLRDKLRERNITTGSSKAKELSLVLYASCGINIQRQTHMVYACKNQVSGEISFSSSPDNKGKYGQLVDKYGDIIMCVGVTISDFVENKGIFRNPINTIEGGYGGISMMLHSFTCLVIQKKFPSVKLFQVQPLKKMGEIILQSLPREKITVDMIPGDKYDKGFEGLHTVQVPIEILAGLYPKDLRKACSRYVE